MIIRRTPPPLTDLKKFAIFLDIDGTLADIAPSPELAVLDQETRDVLSAMSRLSGDALAIISGRQLSEIDRLIGLPQLPAAGIHGAQLRLSRESVTHYDEFADQIAVIHGLVQARLGTIPGIVLERKPLAIAIHYRADPSQGEMILHFVTQLVRNRPELNVITGKMIVEILPASVDKGVAVRQLMSQVPFSGRAPVFAGDDTTDESAFAVVNLLDGISIKIGSGASHAKYGFDDARMFRRWLAQHTVVT